MSQQSISISTSTIIRVFGIALAIWLVYTVRSVLMLVFLSLVLATIMHPLAEWGVRHKIPRGLTVFVVYVIGIALLFAVGAALVPLFITEINQIQDNFASYWTRVIAMLPTAVSTYVKDWSTHSVTEVTNTVKGGLSTAFTGILSTVQGVFGAIGSLLAVLVLTYYMVAEQNSMRRMLASFVSKPHHATMERMIANIEHRLGGWARGQLFLSLIIGALVYVALIVIGVPYPFALAVLAALVEFIPYVGPTIASIFGIFFALTISPSVALITALAYYFIQFLEGHFIVPKVMERTAGISPIVSIIAILLCYELLGVLGVFIGIPIAALVIAVLESFGPRTTQSE